MNKKRLIKLLKTIIPLGLGFFLIWYSLNSSTPEQRQTLWVNIKSANPLYISISLVLGLLSHISRAYRWQYLLQPLGYKPKFLNRFMAVMVAYLANLGIPRSGEILRGVTLTTYEDIPFEKSFGTIISERVADFIMLLVVVGIALFAQSEKLIGYLDSQHINPLLSALALLVVIGAIILGFFILKRFKFTFAIKLRTFVSGLLTGMRSIFNMQHKWAFIAHTIFIWFMYVLMFWVIKYTIPSISTASIGVILAAFVVGSFSISVTNGGIGVYPIAIGALFVFFGFNKEDGEAFGWIVWATQTLLVIVLGALSFIFLPIYNQK